MPSSSDSGASDRPTLIRDFEEHGVRGRASIRRGAPSGPGLEVVVLDPGSGRLRFVIGVRTFFHRPPPAWDPDAPTLTLTPQGERELRSALAPRMAQWRRLLGHAERHADSLDELCAARTRLEDDLRMARRPWFEARRALRAALHEGRIHQREYQASLRAAQQAAEGPLAATHRFEALLEETLGAPVEAEVFDAFVRATRPLREPAMPDALGERVPGASEP